MIGKDMTQRWYDLVPGALDSHAPANGKLPRSILNESGETNLASTAKVKVDSFLGTTNIGEREDFYPILNQVLVIWDHSLNEKFVNLRLSTATPNFDHFSWRFDGGRWQSGNETVLGWALHEGKNHFEVHAINTAGWVGRATEVTASYEYNPLNNSSSIHFDAKNGQATETCKQFIWEDFRHPVLQSVRQKYQLAAIIEPGKNDTEKITLLRDWVKSRWDHDQPIYSPPWNVAHLLDRTDKKIEAFYCVHYSIAFMQCCLALGIPARLVNLHRGICNTPFDQRGYGKELTQEPPCDEHVVNEVWIDDIGKWVLMDVDFDIHYELDGIPLSAVEIHDALLAGELSRLSVCEGPFAWKLKSNPDFYQEKLPVYYTHVCVFWRNNHLSDPEGPDPILHWIDSKTPWMLWWEGEDLHHRPQIIGPVGVSWPYSQSTPVLTDNNMMSCWASSDDPEVHWVVLTWDKPQSLYQVAILWPCYWHQYFNSRCVEIEAWIDQTWKQVAVQFLAGERAIARLDFDEIITSKLRIKQLVGDGSLEYPNRMWIAEIGVYGKAEGK